MNSALIWLKSKREIVLLMLGFTLISGVYSLVTPLFEMSDELWHYPMVKTLANGNGLPIQDPNDVGPWRQEGSQPPLYYYVGAVATFWIDTSDMQDVRRENPHVDNGVITADGNINLIVHRADRERWPWRGTVLAVHLVRFISVIMSTGTLYFTYLIGREVFSERPWLGLAGAGAVGFVPMFAFISGAVNNDNLAVLLSAIGLWLMIRITQESDVGHSTLLLAIWLGITLGLSALTKASVMGQFGLAGLTMMYAAYRRKRWQAFFIEGPIIILIAGAIAGWWYYRNWVLYGDLLGLNAFIEILGQRTHPASLLQLWTEREGFMQSYWGLFGGVNIPMSGWIYAVLNLLAVLSIPGSACVIFQKWRKNHHELSAWIPLLLSLLWIGAVVLPLVSYWARITWSSQGRLVFSAIMSLQLWFVAGLVGWMPEKIGRLVATTIVSLLGLLTLLAPFLWIRPSYILQESLPLSSQPLSIDFYPSGETQPVMRLVDYKIVEGSVRPGESIEVILTWESLALMDRNWSVFIHLEDSIGLLAGQRDTYPGLGLIATSDLPIGYRWTDRYVVPIDAAAYAPESLLIRIGVYDFETCPACARMAIKDGSDALLLGCAALNPSADGAELPNVARFNFGDKLALVGYQLDTREARPGDTLIATLYWEGLEQMGQNYTISVQIVGPNNTRYAQEDSWPQNGNLPTSTWDVGTIVEDTARLTLGADTPPGVYPIQIVVYHAKEDGSIERLQRRTPDGRLIEDFLLLTKIRIGE